MKFFCTISVLIMLVATGCSEDNSSNKTTIQQNSNGNSKEEIKKDNTPPIIELKGGKNLVLDYNQSYSEPGFITTDNIDGDLTTKVKIDSNVDTSKTGEYKVIYSVTDSSGNSASTIRTVKVVDASAPKITIYGDKEINVTLGDTYNEPGAIVTDNMDRVLNLKTSHNIDLKNIGSYKVKYSATDSSGNSSEAYRVVNVVSPSVIVDKFNVTNTQCDSWNKEKIYPNSSEYFYTLSNNDWGRKYLDSNSTGIQCIFNFNENGVSKGGWYWGWPSNNDYQVKGYPEAIYGTKFKSKLNPNSGFPSLVDNIKSVNVDLAYKDLAITGKYNIALEFWLHTKEDTSMDNIEYEVMFRFDPKGFHPAKIHIGKVKLGGILFDVYKDKSYNGTKNRIFINFVAKSNPKDGFSDYNELPILYGTQNTKVSKNININFKEALDYLTNIEFKDIPNTYMSGIEMGVEVISGSGALILDTFNVNLTKKYSYIPENIDDYTAVRFLNKATFGATPQSVKELKEKGVIKWLDDQLNMPLNDKDLHLRTTIDIAKKFEPDSFKDSIEDYLIDNDIVFNKEKASFQLRRYQNSAWFTVSLFQKDQLREKTTYALSQIIVESLAEPIFTRRAEAIARYFDILRDNTFGNYKNLLLDISHSSSMSLYLTFNGNKKEHTVGDSIVYPDENYAREIMQLFSIGLKKLNIDGTPILDKDGNTIPTYTQKDITEVAKVFTGWDIQRNPYFGRIAFTKGDLTHPTEFTSDYHDYREKKILGTTIPASLSGDEDIEAMINILINNPNIAPFISKILIQRLTKSNPSREYVTRVAKVFNDNSQGVKGDLKAVVKAIFTDKEFWKDIKEKRLVKFKEPIVALTQFYRAFNAKPFHKFRLKGKNYDIEDVFFVNEPSSIGEVPGRAFSVFNFYDKDFIPNDEYFKENRLVAPELQIQTEAAVISLNNHLFDRLRVFEKKVVGSGGGNIRWDRITLDCSEEDEVIELALEGSVDGNITNLKDISYTDDKESNNGNETKRELALKALINHLDKKITGEQLPQEFKDELFKKHIETFYSSKIANKDDKTKREIYKWITVPLIVAIMTSNINMTE